MWISEWLGVPYCSLYARYKGKGFTFQDARRELDIPGSTLLKMLSELGKAGFLLSMTRGRETVYMLSDFDSVALGIRASRYLANLDVPQKLRKACAEYGRKYLVIGGSAAFLYHCYQFPSGYDVKVYSQDYGFWRNLLPEANLAPTLKEMELRERREIDGLFVASPERIIVDGIRQGRTSSILDSISVLLSEKGLKSIAWDVLARYAIRYSVANEVGALLEALDRELIRDYGKSLIPKRIRNELFTHIRKSGRLKMYPRDVLEEDTTYADIGERWRLRLRLPSYVIRKPVEDIAPVTMNVV